MSFFAIQESLLPVESNAPLYAQLYTYENLDNEIIEKLSVMVIRCNLFARIYCHMYGILSDHESPGTNSEDRSNNDDFAKSGPPYVIISPSENEAY
ncbi:hypothetical protein BCV72DRAFT_226922 [Rhizopus microsporus var. microsporus]|uniref:Uncharacterized protein n=2 Tax=Rhizopus microsporus TaxID=58291 RepID=A0A2G4SY53_RHIZD|nr:uncharacterized protein RHIMIDRAFT_278983 [Rhizopus microsporus ATCC 52813]ORE07327.1 hypothetical protein BCV72DRAFT_226922 [Rhizopus microsporus var. microsporus]PHZ13306.1 hypothetical protein RHIMIDRAFT_278983 [Rhizopus microsporus ATCC 52813]